MANQLQRRSRRRPVRFMVADLSVRGLHRMVGRDFDFVSCHGVLTYVPAPTRALRSLARCLAPDGALYLGVNGSRHRSIPLRDALPAFGFDAARLVDTPALREVLRLLNALLPPFDRMVRETAPYLASDVFGPLFQNLPLAAWIGVGREAGLHFQGSFSSHRDLRPVFEQGLGGQLAPRSRAEICELLDIMQPAAFHRLLFTRTRASNPPWARYDRLVTWRPVLTNLYRSRLPARSGSGTRTITFRSPATNTRVSSEMPAWQVELLGRSDGARSIQDTLSRLRSKVAPDELVQQLYVLHQLLVINLLPPAGSIT